MQVRCQYIDPKNGEQCSNVWWNGDRFCEKHSMDIEVLRRRVIAIEIAVSDLIPVNHLIPVSDISDGYSRQEYDTHDH